LASFWNDVGELVRQPLFLEGMAVVVMFVFVLLVFRRIRGIAATLERRRALSEYVRGLDDFLRGDYRAAVATLEDVLVRDPDNVEARIALGDCYRETGDAAEAKKHHHHVHRVFGHELGRNFLSLGRDELALGNHDLAVEAFGRAIELDPTDRDALAGLAQANAEGGNPVAAADALRSLYPDGPTPEIGNKARRDASRRFADAGAAVLREGDAERAVRLFTEALAFQKENVRARAGLLRAADSLGDTKRAREIAEAHLAELRRLVAEDGVLFEPATFRGGPAAGDGAPPPPGASHAPAIENAGALVAAIDERTARYACAQCGTLQRDFRPRCPRCGAVGTLEALPELAALYTMPLPGFGAAVDEVEGNAAFVHAIAREASLGDAAALGKLLALGPSAIYEVFAALPALEARRALGERMAALGPAAAREVRECHAARARASWTGAPGPHDEFAAAFHLALGEADAAVGLAALGPPHDAAVAGCLADPRLSATVRDAARAQLARRGTTALAAVIEAVAASGDPGAVARAAELVRGWGAGAVEEIERRFFNATLLGRLFFRRGARRKAAADVLARCGLVEAREALGRAAAREKDPELRAHYAAAKGRADAGGPP